MINEKIAKGINKYMPIITLMGGTFFFWIGMSTMYYYENLYGVMAKALWISGLFTGLGLMGLTNTLEIIIKKIKSSQMNSKANKKWIIK